MKLLFGFIFWMLQLFFLIVVALFKAVGQLFGAVGSITKGHLSENKERGKTFVRAYYFLEALEGGAGFTPEEANNVASSLFAEWSDPEVDNRVIRRAIAYAKHKHGGNQLLTIAEAREKGYLG